LIAVPRTLGKRHPALGRITVPGSPLRRHGTRQTPATPSPAIGAHNAEVYAELPGLSADEVAALADDRVI
jgi:crotonobetainyl-CoA:carnitine CoA-transferase CaiB-like acyl-CoA transferase